MDQFINVEVDDRDNSIWYVIWRGNFWLLMITVFITGMFVGSGLIAFLLVATTDTLK